MKIYYDVLPNFYSDEAFVRAITDIANESFTIAKNEKPQWLKEMQGRFVTGENTLKDFFNRVKTPFKKSLPSPTIKTCPGFTNIFNCSLLIKAPCDFIIKTYKDLDTPPELKASYKHISMHEHSWRQAPGLRNFVACNLSTGFAISTKEKCSYTFIDPIYYQEVQHRVAPGLLPGTSKGIDLNTILLLPREDKLYFYEAGEPLAMVVFNKPLTNLVHVPKMPTRHVQTIGFSKFYSAAASLFNIK